MATLGRNSIRSSFSQDVHGQPAILSISKLLQDSESQRIENCSLGGSVKKMQGDVYSYISTCLSTSIHPSTAEKQPKIDKRAKKSEIKRGTIIGQKSEIS